MLKKTAWLLILVFLCGVVTYAAAPPKVKVTFWDENAGPNRTPYLQEMIKKFNAANATIEVEYVGLPWDHAKEKIDVAIAASSPPDCSGCSTSWISDFAANKAIIPLDPYFNKWAERKQFLPTHIQGLRDLVPDKKLYELPNTFNANLFWYRPDWFREAGLNPPATWDDIFNDIMKMTDKSKRRYGFSIRGGSVSTITLEALMYAYSGITEYFNKNGKCTANDPLNVEFVKKYVGLYGKYTPESDITNGYKEMVANYDNNVAAIITHNLGSYDEHRKTLGAGKFAAVAYPVGKKGKRVAITTINGYVIYKGSKHPAETFKFIGFMNSQENQSFWNKTIGQLPTRRDSMSEPWVAERQHLQVISDAFNDKRAFTMKRPNYLPDYSAIHSKMEPQFQEVLLGKRSVETFMNDWATTMEKSLAEYNKMVKK